MKTDIAREPLQEAGEFQVGAQGAFARGEPSGALPSNY